MNFLKENELIITTGFVFETAEYLFSFIDNLVTHKCCGLIVNIGKYIDEIPTSVIEYCNQLNFPLFTMPWQTRIIEVSRDYCNRIYKSEEVSNSLALAFHNIFLHPEKWSDYQDILKVNHFKVDSHYHCILLHIDSDRKNSSEHFRTLEQLTSQTLYGTIQNYCTFVYQENLLLIVSDSSTTTVTLCAHRLLESFSKQLHNEQLYIGIGTCALSLTDINSSLTHAVLSLEHCLKVNQPLIVFEELGVLQILLSLPNKQLLHNYYDKYLLPLEEYDQKHSSNLTETLQLYIRYDSSVQKVADFTFTHRNTINYRMQRIKEILNTNLQTNESKFPYQMAFYIKECL